MMPGKPRAACLGAGLLLQLAVGEALRGPACTEAPGEMPGFPGTDSAHMAGAGSRCHSVPGLLEQVEAFPRIALEYAYGEKGKPYLRDFPFYFSLSHSGDYVLCALSGSEIGADIQICRAKDAGRIGQRFFSEREAAALESAALQSDGDAGESLFFRLWARKEAYGKLTGEGLPGALGVELLPGTEVPPEGKGLLWEEYGAPEGYRIAVCRFQDAV